MNDTIAITGIACRYPGGVASPEDLWDLIVSERSAIDRLCGDRGWSEEQKQKWIGGFIESATEFDADFFGLSEDDATALDPQQRLVLECTWEVLERARIIPASLRGSRTGVYLGMMYNDYPDDPRDPGAGLIGNLPSMASRRISYTFGFEGPSLTIDTSCSSGIVGLHLACQALRAGECDMAVAAGVTVMSTPTIFEQFGRNGWLASDGHSKPYADHADGTGFGEGAGVVLVERLDSARRAGRQVWAAVRGSALNQDGATAGLDIPKGASQTAVIHDALRASGLNTCDVDLVEGNANGSLMADPIELKALQATYGTGRSAGEPVWLGSVKSNLGHTQAAGGMAGLIKAVMAIRARTMPRSLNVDAPTSKVDWSEGGIRLLTAARPWPARNGQLRRAALSSFGISSTNAHVILEEAPPPDTVDGDDGRGTARTPADVPIPLSADSPAALRATAARLRTAVVASRAVVTDVGAALARHRSPMRYRATLLVGTREELLSGLDELSRLREPGHRSDRRAGRRAPILVTSKDAAGNRVATPEPAQLWRNALGRRAVILADGDDDAETLRDLLAGGGRRTVVVTGPTHCTQAARSWVDEVVGELGATAAEITVTTVHPAELDGARSLLDLLRAAEADGVDVDWSVFFDATAGRDVDLPTYPFQRTRHWVAGRSAGVVPKETG